MVSCTWYTTYGVHTCICTIPGMIDTGMNSSAGAASVDWFWVGRWYGIRHIPPRLEMWRPSGCHIVVQTETVVFICTSRGVWCSRARVVWYTAVQRCISYVKEGAPYDIPSKKIFYSLFKYFVPATRVQFWSFWGLLLWNVFKNRKRTFSVFKTDRQPYGLENGPFSGEIFRFSFSGRPPLGNGAPFSIQHRDRNWRLDLESSWVSTHRARQQAFKCTENSRTSRTCQYAPAHASSTT